MKSTTPALTRARATGVSMPPVTPSVRAIPATRTSRVSSTPVPLCSSSPRTLSTTTGPKSPMLSTTFRPVVGSTLASLPSRTSPSTLVVVKSPSLVSSSTTPPSTVISPPVSVVSRTLTPTASLSSVTLPSRLPLPSSMSRTTVLVGPTSPSPLLTRLFSTTL